MKERRASRRRVDRNSRIGETFTEVMNVAPHAGAWIETRPMAYSDEIKERRASRRRVDRNWETYHYINDKARRASRRRVDRNSLADLDSTLYDERRASRRRTDRNRMIM